MNPNNPYGTYTTAEGAPLSLKGTLGEQNLAANKIPGAIWKPAVVTSATPAVKTTQNVADLTTATAPKIPVPTYGQTIVDSQGRVGVAKFDPNTGLPLEAPVPEQKAPTEKKDTVVDGAIRKELGLPAEPTPRIKSQEEIDAETQLAAKRAEMDTLMKTMDARSASIIQGITAEYDSLIKQQEVQNKAYEGGVTTEGLVSGRGRYAPVMQAGIIHSAISEGLGKISALQAKKQSLILQAENARDEKNFKALNDSMNQYRDTIKEERKLAQDTYENAIKASKEARDVANDQRIAEKDIFTRSMDTSNRVAPGLAEIYSSITDPQAQAKFITDTAKTLGIDSTVLFGDITKNVAETQKTTKNAVLDLGKKYTSAGILETDTFAEATKKVRNSKEYKLDVLKTEADIANAQSLAKTRADIAAVDFKDPALTLYTQATGIIADSPSQAKGIIGYADNLLADKEIVADDYKGNLNANQIKASDARKLLTDAFTNIHTKSEKAYSSSEMWKDLATPEYMAMTDEQKGQKIKEKGLNPEDFGVYY